MDFTISPVKFYGPPSLREREIDEILKKRPLKGIPKLPSYVLSLLGPDRTWKIFSRLQEALNFLKCKTGDVMPFAFEHGQGSRSFLVCHPILLYFVLSRRSENERCTYEIIQENKHSKLYLDIEFECEYNVKYNGKRMLQNALKIICHRLEECFSIKCLPHNILDLDSSTHEKFSHHVIFQLQGFGFENNYAVGRFVKDICLELTDAISNLKLMTQICQKYGIIEDHIRELLVLDRKGMRKPFIDTSVYTKNRHFRLMGSTKLNKNSPLTLSKTNELKIDNKEEYSYFLASLVTYFDEEIKLLTYGTSHNKDSKLSRITSRPSTIKQLSESTSLDQFIQQLIQPKGRIRRKLIINGDITFDIVGNRFCGNIQREHRSNNIKLVVDTSHCTYYQACYDPDCKNYRSQDYPLPLELHFKPDEEQVFQEIGENLISDEHLLQLVESNDDSAFFEDGNNNHKWPEQFSTEDNEILLNVSLDDPVCLESDKSCKNEEEFWLSDSELIGAVESIDMCNVNEDLFSMSQF